nr:putative reverse transcriptase domain-containing protein [Tanacetum cinerariifolium]
MGWKGPEGASNSAVIRDFGLRDEQAARVYATAVILTADVGEMTFLLKDTMKMTLKTKNFPVVGDPFGQPSDIMLWWTNCPPKDNMLAPLAVKGVSGGNDQPAGNEYDKKRTKSKQNRAQNGKRGKVNSQRLHEELSGVHVSNLKKCLADASLHVPLDENKVDKTLRFVEEPVEIMDLEVKRLKRSRISLMKVCWNSKRGPEFTWEREDYMKSKYPQFFVYRANESASQILGRDLLKEEIL